MSTYTTIALVLVSALVALPSCGTGGGGGDPLWNASPTFAFVSPSDDVIACRSGYVTIRYRDDDPDGRASTTLAADRDGDPSTVGDQLVIESDRPDQNGAVQTVVWNTSGVALDRYYLVAFTSDGANPDVVTRAAGRVTLANVSWASSAGGDSLFDDHIEDLAVFPDGSCVVTGSFYEDWTLGKGEANETVLENYGHRDAYVARYGADGTLAWARNMGDGDLDEALEVETLADGSCLVAGRFYWSALFGEGEANETTLQTEGGFDIFLARYNADGGF